MAQRTTPPFRADHVGSLLRTKPLKEARARRERNEISADELRAIEDREIAAIISKQEDIGLGAVTDGEFRRAFWNYDFLGALPGVEAYLGERKIKFKGVNPKPMMLRVSGKLGTFSGHPMLEHFRFTKAHARILPKMTIPSPSSLHFRYGREAVPEAIYPDMRDFYRDLGQTYRLAVRAFADAGCRYLQLDEVNLAYLCDPSLRAQVAGRGEDPEKLAMIYAGMINAAISDVPSDMTIAMHLCRGNFQSTFVASGGYEPVAEILFNAIRNMTVTVPAGSSLCASCPRARLWCSDSSPRNRGDLNAETFSSAVSTRPQSMCRWSNCVCRRNAASLPPRRETFSPRKSSGRSCG
jgi:methionine synthase II (cobalamin-independent)